MRWGEEWRGESYRWTSEYGGSCYLFAEEKLENLDPPYGLIKISKRPVA
jgi:hypothetical protein